MSRASDEGGDDSSHVSRSLSWNTDALKREPPAGAPHQQGGQGRAEPARRGSLDGPIRCRSGQWVGGRGSFVRDIRPVGLSVCRDPSQRGAQLIEQGHPPTGPSPGWSLAGLRVATAPGSELSQLGERLTVLWPVCPLL